MITYFNLLLESHCLQLQNAGKHILATPLEDKAQRALPVLCPVVKLSCPPVQNLNEPPVKLNQGTNNNNVNLNLSKYKNAYHIFFLNITGCSKDYVIERISKLIVPCKKQDEIVQ